MSNYRVICDPIEKIRIVKTEALEDRAKLVFASHRSAKAAVFDEIEYRIRALRRIRDEAVHVLDAALPLDVVESVEKVAAKGEADGD